MTRAFKNQLWALLNQGLMAGAGLVSFILLARWMPAAELGNWILYLAAFTFAEMVKSGLLQTGLIRTLSGQSEESAIIIRGSAWMLSLCVVGVFTLLCLSGLAFTTWFSINTGIFWFLLLYPVLSIIMLPVGHSLWFLQSKNAFHKILRVRFIWLFALLVGIIIAGLTNGELAFMTVALLHMGSYLAAALFTFINRWTGIKTLSAGSKKTIKELFKFGRYSLGSSLGAHLLKSADIFLIGAFLGPVSVAIYGIALKFLEVLEMPIRAVVATALPTLSALSNKSHTKTLSARFHQYCGMLVLMVVPISIVGFIYAEEIIGLLGGAQYKASAAPILRIFMIYALMLPFDRLLGIALDATGYPSANFRKVLLMVSINVVGDCIVLAAGLGLEWVALVTVLNISAGVLLGGALYNRVVGFSWKGVFQSIGKLSFSFVRLLPRIKSAA